MRHKGLWSVLRETRFCINGRAAALDKKANHSQAFDDSDSRALLYSRLLPSPHARGYSALNLLVVIGALVYRSYRPVPEHYAP